jgi:hypothetical protein
MNILSIDVGIKNLAFCFINIINNKPIINKWGIIDNLDSKTKCKDVPIEKLSEIVLLNLHNNFSALDIDTVLIESQPCMKNPTMKTIQNVITTYFQYNKVINKKNIKSVRLVMASNKLKLIHKNKCIIDEKITNTKDKYKQRKLLSIEYAKYYLKNIYPNEEKLAELNAIKKADDIVDGYNQAMWYFETYLLDKNITQENNDIIQEI